MILLIGGLAVLLAGGAAALRSEKRWLRLLVVFVCVVGALVGAVGGLFLNEIVEIAEVVGIGAVMMVTLGRVQPDFEPQPGLNHSGGSYLAGMLAVTAFMLGVHHARLLWDGRGTRKPKPEPPAELPEEG